jgi:hypothetical protein
LGNQFTERYEIEGGSEGEIEIKVKSVAESSMFEKKKNEREEEEERPVKGYGGKGAIIVGTLLHLKGAILASALKHMKGASLIGALSSTVSRSCPHVHQGRQYWRRPIVHV